MKCRKRWVICIQVVDMKQGRERCAGKGGGKKEKKRKR
jgi:hypothetical protein